MSVQKLRDTERGGAAVTVLFQPTTLWILLLQNLFDLVLKQINKYIHRSEPSSPRLRVREGNNNKTNGNRTLKNPKKYLMEKGNKSSQHVHHRDSLKIPLKTSNDINTT